MRGWKVRISRVRQSSNIQKCQVKRIKQALTLSGLLKKTSDFSLIGFYADFSPCISIKILLKSIKNCQLLDCRKSVKFKKDVEKIIRYSLYSSIIYSQYKNTFFDWICDKWPVVYQLECYKLVLEIQICTRLGDICKGECISSSEHRLHIDIILFRF